MQTWSISYTADKFKPKNRKWFEGKMNFNVTSGQVNVYDEDGEEIERMRVRREEIYEDAALTLKRHVVEIGMLEKEEESVDDLFTKLNEELGIVKEESRVNDKESGAVGLKRSYPSGEKPVASVITKAQPVRSLKRPIQITKAEELSVELYDVLYTRDKGKKIKTWLDGVMKFFQNKKIGEFYSEQGVLLYKKIIMEEVIKDGEIFETADLIIEICGGQRKETSVIERKQLAPNGTTKKRYEILYTKDKHKKGKKWLDGWIEFDPVGGNANFYTEDSECFYKKIFKNEGQMVEGAEIESGMYLIQIMNEKVINSVDSYKKILTSNVNTLDNVIASEEVPLTGRSDTELLRLLGVGVKTNSSDSKKENNNSSAADDDVNRNINKQQEEILNNQKKANSNYNDESDDLESLEILLK